MIMMMSFVVVVVIAVDANVMILMMEVVLFVVAIDVFVYNNGSKRLEVWPIRYLVQLQMECIVPRVRINHFRLVSVSVILIDVI